jgi:hypothetical protein
LKTLTKLIQRRKTTETQMFILFEPLQLKAILEDYARIYIFENKQIYRFHNRDLTLSALCSGRSASVFSTLPLPVQNTRNSKISIFWG